MNAFRTVRDYFVFTRNEQKILLLLSVVFLAGAGIKAYRSMTAAPGERRFEYAAADSVFAARAASAAPALAATKKKIDLNSATRSELIALPGIGPALAERILAYRAAHRRFRTITDLKSIAGIGPKKFERLRGSIEVTPETGR